MGALRNGAIAILATGLLLGGLLILVPAPAGATTVLLQSGNISQPVITTDPAGVVNDVYSFDVKVTVALEKGEHVALDYAKVVVGPASASLDGSGFLVGTCTATTGGATNFVTIVSVTGAERVSAPLVGYGYSSVVASGYGYDFAGRGAVNYGGASGYGYGYGYTTTAGVNLVVQLKVTGCVGPVGSSFPLAFASASNPELPVRVQAFIGQSASQLFPSVPVAATLFDPNFAAPATTSTVGAGTVTATSTSSSGGQNGIVLTLNDADGDGTAFEPIPGSTQLPAFTFPGTLGSNSALSAQITTGSGGLPAGSQVQFTFQDQGTQQSADSPPFGIQKTILDGQLAGRPPALFFQVQVSVPGQGNVDPTPLIDVDLRIEVPSAYFSASGFSPSTFQLRGFRDDGTLKAALPTMIAGPTLNVAGTDYEYTFRITDFSSFAGFAAISGGGIGGGGGGGGSTPVTNPTTPTTPTGSSSGTTAPSGTTSGTTAPSGTATTAPSTAPSTTGQTSSKGGIPGFEAVALVVALAALALVVRRRMA